MAQQAIPAVRTTPTALPSSPILYDPLMLELIRIMRQDMLEIRNKLDAAVTAYNLLTDAYNTHATATIAKPAAPATILTPNPY